MAAPMCENMAVIFKSFLCFSAFLFLACSLSTTNAAKLSDPKVLLPYHSSVITNFTLTINLTKDEMRSPSCYTWRSSRLDVATLELINSTDNECALSAQISAVSKSPNRKTSIVMAENKVTGEILKCIVIVDTLYRIEIETTTRLLYLEDSPEELMVRGYDAEGNVFSSLRGLEFKWSLHADTSGDQDSMIDANSILRIIKFSDSYYTTPYHIDKLEEQGKQGDIILAEGVRTGSAIVWAKVKDGAYETVSHSSVRLMVIANLMVSPPEAYVLKFAMVKYKVEQIRQNAVVEIKMPSSQFFLQVVDSDISSLDAKTSVATALELGETEIKLIDRNIKTSDTLGQPSAILHVVSASYLAFVVLPDRKWVLETGRVYEVIIEVYDKNSHKIYPSDNVIIDALFPGTYFEIQFSSKNGTYHVVKTLQKGDTDIDGGLSTIIKQDGSEYSVTPAIKQSQYVEIFDPISVKPDLLFFPWDPVKQISHSYQLKAQGGSGEYVWSSDNADTVTVNKYGEITTSYRGEAFVTAADRRNQLHTGVAEVHILPPSDMEFLPDRVEIQVGEVLELPLDVRAKYDGRRFSFNDCRYLPLNVTFLDTTVGEYLDAVSELRSVGCRIIKVKALQQGHTKVVATYNHGGVKLESSITIATYDKLIPIDPEKEAVVTIGSSKEVIFAGGPQPWVLDSSKYFRTMNPDDSKNVIIEPVNVKGTQKRLHNFYVSCKKFGEQTLTLMVGNEKTAKNPNPVVEEASISFICAEPVEIHLQPQIEYPKDLPPCPVAREPNEPIPVHCQKNLDLTVSVTDKNGRKFDNISSLDFQWTVSDSEIATLENTDELQKDVTILPSGRKVVSNYVTLHPYGIPDTVIVSVSVSKYKRNYLELVNSPVSERISPKISKSVELRLVEEAVISPSVVSVFNHPSNKMSVAIEKGSGYFHVVEGRAEIVELKYAEKKKQLQVLPLQDGQLTVTVHDLCVASQQPATLSVTVSGVGSVQLYVMDKVEVGNDIEARVQVLDVTGHKLFASFFTLMGLRLEPASELITIKPDSSPSADEYTARYIVHGAVIGHTSLKAKTLLPDGTLVTSDAKPVEVFPPLELIPRNITLIVGAHFQVLSRGGPRPQCTVVYSIQDDAIAGVSSSGLLDAKVLGTTRVVGQAVGQHPETGETVIYSQDEVTVNVVRLVGIRIHAPLTGLQTGTTMPVYAVGLTEHETPFTFGSAAPPLSFNWSVNKKDVARLQSVFHESGVKPQPEGNFAVQMVAMETGHVSVKLEVTPQKGHNQILGDKVLVDELQIQVFTKLAMVSPKVCDGELLMTPNTEAVLKTNRDGGAKMTYKIMSTENTSDIVYIEDGVLVSGSYPGQAALHITAQEEFGISQTLVLLVKVKSVSYLMVNSNSALRTSGGHLTTVPRGTTLQFTVTYHDDVGEEFYATNIDMKYRCSRYDLVQVSHGLENNTLVMKTAAEGHTILKVWDSHKPWLTDFISIPVGYAIEPSQPRINLGGIVCFKSTVTSDKGAVGSWSGNTAVSVHPKLGIVLAESVGIGSVLYTVSEEITTENEVFVDPIEMVTIETGSEFITTVTDVNKVYNFLVNIGNHPQIQGSDCSSIIAAEGYQPTRKPFTCDLRLETSSSDISVDDLFTTTAVFLSKSGRYACQVTPASTSVTQQISTMEVKLRLSVSILPMKGQAGIQAPPTILSFLPPFYTHNSEVHVSTLTPLSSVRISTIPELSNSIQSSATSLNLEVKLRLSVSILPMKGQAGIQAPPTILSFLPPFYTHNSEVHVSTLTPLSSVRISTIPELSNSIQLKLSSATSLDLEVKLRLSVSILPMKGQAGIQAPPTILSFLPPFYTHISEVHVSTLTPLSSVRISTIPELSHTIQAVVSDPSILEALQPESDAQSKSILIYPIRLLETVTLWERETLDVWVNLICQKTGQKVKIPVFIRLIGQKPDISSLRFGKDAGWGDLFTSIINNYRYWFMLLLIIIVTAFCVLWGYHLIYGNRYKPGPNIHNTSGYGNFMMSPGGAAPPYQGGYSPVAPASPPPYDPYGQLQSPKTPMLWSTGQTFPDGTSPIRRRSPIQRISPS